MQLADAHGVGLGTFPKRARLNSAPSRPYPLFRGYLFTPSGFLRVIIYYDHVSL